LLYQLSYIGKTIYFSKKKQNLPVFRHKIGAKKMIVIFLTPQGN